MDDSAFRPKSGLTNLQRIAMDASRALPPLVPPQAPTPSPEHATFPVNDPFSSATINERASEDEITRDAASNTASWTEKVQQHVHGIVGVVVGVIQDKANREKKQLQEDVVSLRARLGLVEEDIATYKRLLARRSSENGNRN